MKKALLVLLAIFTVLTIVGCPPPPPADLTSEWWIKGSFDNWVGGAADSTSATDIAARHYLTMSELDNNVQTYTISGCYLNLGYEFVVVSPDGVEYKAADGTALTDGATAVTLVAGDTTGAANVKFTAAKASYTVTFNVATATAPTVAIVGGADAAPLPTVAVMAANLDIRGTAFAEITWGSGPEGVLVDNGDGTGTVTWAGLTAGNKAGGEFGLPSLDGWLKQAVITGLDTAGEVFGPFDLVAADPNNKIDACPFSDSKYTVVVTLNAAGATVGDRYKLTVTLTDVGSTAWAFEPWAAVYVPGTITSWTAGSFGVATASATAGIWTYDYTATADGAQSFKIVAVNDWVGDVGFAGVLTTGSAVTLADDGGNIGFTAVNGTVYRITIDMTVSTFAADGKPLVTVATVTP